jgi:mono/diheme cytochrome c family protein
MRAGALTSVSAEEVSEGEGFLVRRLMSLVAGTARAFWLLLMAMVAIPAMAFAVDTDQIKAAPVNPFEGHAEKIPEGQSLFNQYCSHCHAPNAQTAERARDVRRLKLRYGDRMTEVFYNTVTEGRIDNGMPAWKGALSDDVLWTIYTFIQSMQQEP